VKTSARTATAGEAQGWRAGDRGVPSGAAAVAAVGGLAHSGSGLDARTVAKTRKPVSVASDAKRA
jgi:hypothetical protein